MEVNEEEGVIPRGWFVRRILIDPINPGVIYAGISGVNASWIYMSEDGGESWFPCPFPKLEMDQGKRYSLYDGNTLLSIVFDKLKGGYSEGF